MKSMNRNLLLTLTLWGGIITSTSAQTMVATDTNLETQVAVVFSSGYETVPVDHGRPVVLIAAALNVPPEIFRDAFSSVTPAPAGEAPDPGQVRLNK